MKTMKSYLSLLRLAALSCFFVPATSALAAMAEFDNCNVPQEIIFQSTPHPFFPSQNEITRYVRYAGQSTFTALYRNPEGVPQHDPIHAQNCTIGGAPNKTQWVTFDMQTTNYFDSLVHGQGLGGHIVIMGRAAFSNSNQIGSEAYRARGIIFGKAGGLDGVRGQLFLKPNTNNIALERWYYQDTPGQFSPRDGVAYSVAMHINQNTVAYSVTDRSVVAGPTPTGIAWHPWTYTTQLTFDQGLAFGVLCNFEGGNTSNGCRANPQLTVRFSNISTGWF